MENAEKLPAETPEDDGPKLGIFDDIPNLEYHRGKGISKSGLDLLNRSPLHFITAKRNPKPPTPAMIFGQAIHTLILEPDKFDEEFILMPENAPRMPTELQLNPKKGQAKPEHCNAKDWWDSWNAMSEGKIILTDKAGENPFWQPGDWSRLHYMRDAVMAHPIASILLDPDQGIAEQSVYWIDDETKKLCKCRPDFRNTAHNVAVDLKSTTDASFTGFGKSVANFRYHVQDAYYRDGLHAVGATVSAFVFVAVEKDPPYAVACYIVEKEAQRIGRIQYQSNLHTYAECMARDVWPGYPGTESVFDPTIRDLAIAPWGLKGFVS